ncbi:MAG: carboxymuconolactone decarboxylase family protein [Alphaproteobacteria bacterium]
MILRIDYKSVAPKGFAAMAGLGRYVDECGLDKKLIYLVELRVSQINGCAYCVDLHSRELRGEGETAKRIDSVVVWRESPFFTPRERAALAWAESVTLIAESHAPDDIYEEARRHFGEKELVDLTYAIAAMNAWNRLGVSFRQLPSA